MTSRTKSLLLALPLVYSGCSSPEPNPSGRELREEPAVEPAAAPRAGTGDPSRANAARVMPARVARSIASEVGALTAVTAPMRATQAFWMISKLAY